jgi:hypothetical protein
MDVDEILTLHGVLATILPRDNGDGGCGTFWDIWRLFGRAAFIGPCTPADKPRQLK